MSSLSDKQSRFFQSLEHGSLEQLGSKQNVSELLESLPKSQHETLFTLMHERLAQTTNVLAQVSGLEDTTSRLQLQEGLNSLHTLFHVVEACISQVDAKTKAISATLFKSIQLFHDILLALPHPEGSHLQNCLSLLFEKLYTKHYTVRATTAVPDIKHISVDNLLPMTLSYLLLRSLEADSTNLSEDAQGMSGSTQAGNGGKKSDIVRLYAMRHGLSAFDYEDETSESMKSLLIRCMIHPLFLRLLEGRRFLAFIFTEIGNQSASIEAKRNLMQMFHAAIKYQLPLCKSSLIPLYGDVYVRAWRNCCTNEENEASSFGQRECFEQDVIQDLMYCTVHAAHSKTFTALSALLSTSFHDASQKKLNRVEEMLQRLYEPILWRAIKAANPLVRRHAVEIFIDVFPLVHPEISLAGVGANNGSCSFANNDEFLQFQFDTLQQLLVDTDLGIRVLAISGCCKILCSFWEMLPLAVSKGFIVHMARHSIKDASSGAAAVRTAVIQGFTYILDNVLSHPLLKIILPTLRDSLFDANDGVQVAFVDLLLVVKKLKDIKYYEVVPLDDIMLAIQTPNKNPKIVHKLLQLILNSYFPASKPLESILTRCMTLLRSHPFVFALMCNNLHEFEHGEGHISQERRVQLIQGLYKLMVSNVKQQREKFMAAKAANDGDDEDVMPKNKKSKISSQDALASAEPLYVDVTNAVHFETLLSVLVTLYKNLNLDALSENAALESELIQTFSDGGLSVLLATVGTRSPSMRMNIIHLSALLPDVCSPDLHEISLPHLLELSPATNPPVAEYGPILECMVAWGRQEEVLKHIYASLSLYLNGGLEFATLMQDAHERKSAAREFHRVHGERMQALKEAQQNKQKKNRSQAARKHQQKQKELSVNEEEGIETLLHPLMALKYLKYLFENEKTRAVLLQDSVEWSSSPSTESAAAAASSASSSSGGRVVGFLAEILGVFSNQLVTIFKEFVDSEISAADEPLDTSRIEFINLLAQAVQVDMKCNLHVHARLKLLAQRANEIAAEEAERALAAAEEQAEDDGAPLRITTTPTVSHIEMFPRNVENILDMSSFVLLPMWKQIVDVNKKVKHSDVAAADVSIDDLNDSRTKKSKKRDESKAATAYLPLQSLSSLLTSHMLFLSQYSCELLTLGYFHPQCPLRHILCWLDLFQTMQAETRAANEAGLKVVGGDKKLFKKQKAFGPATIDFLKEFIVHQAKVFYQLTVVGSLTPAFGNSKNDISYYHKSDPAFFTFPALTHFVRSFASLASYKGLGEIIATSPVVKTSIEGGLKNLQLSKAAMARSVWLCLETLVDDVKCAHDNLLPLTPVDSTEEIRSFALLLLSAISRNPLALFALPKAMTMCAEQLAAHSPANERQIVARLGVAVGVLAQLGEVNVKMNKKRHEYLSTLLECTKQLTLVASSEPSIVPAVAAPALVAPSSPSTRTQPPASDDGVAPMDVCGNTPAKGAASVVVEAAVEEDKENAPAAAQPQAADKSAVVDQPTKASAASVASVSSSMWDLLQTRLNSQLQKLAV